MPDVKSIHAAKGWRQLGVGLHTVRERLVLSRLLLGMFLFSLFSLVYIGLFPSVARLAFGIESSSNTYRWLYAIWGTGAFLRSDLGRHRARARRPPGAHRARLRRLRDLLGVFSQARGPALAFPVAFAARASPTS